MDVRVNATGDGSGAAAAMATAARATKDAAEEIKAANKKISDAFHQQLLDNQKTAAEQAKAFKEGTRDAWEALAKGAAVAAAAVAAFAVSSMKAYADSERIQRQLVRASGEYAQAISDQSEELSRLYAVDDDLIKQSAVLLSQWGGAAAASREAQVAALNLAAAMGTDLKTATADLFRNVESGGTGLAKLGIHFTTTGDRGKDLEAVIAAVNKKLGGAAAADANSLTGQTHAATLAFEDFQKAFGATLTGMANASGVIPQVTAWMRELTDTVFTPSIKGQREDPAGMIQFWEEVASGNATAWKDQAAGIQFTFEEAQEQLAMWRKKLRPDDFNVGDGTPGVTGQTNKAMKEAEAAAAAHATKTAEQQKKNAEDWKKYLQGIDDLDEASLVKDRENYADELEMSAKRVALAEKEADDKIAIMLQEMAKESAARTKHEKDRDTTAAKWREETAKSNAEAAKKQEQEWGSAGAAIGNAFTSALATQLEALSSGGEFDVAIFVGDILASAVAIAGTVIGSAYGQPELGAALGNLAAMGVRAGAGAISKNNKKRRAAKMHDGGWVGDEQRHHNGAWIGEDERRAILQTGERVLSRQEVHHMGGPAGVDNMAKGRGGPTIVNNIQAIDSKNAAESFMADLGQGMKRALRTGHGDVPRLLGNPR